MQNRRYASHVRQAQIQKYALYGLAALVLLILLILGIRALANRAPADDTKAPADESDLQVTQSVPPLDAGSDEAAPESGAEALAAAPDTQKPASTSTAKKLPIIYRKKDETKRVAITVDDCFSADNVRKIVALAEKYGADLTFFPKGSTIKGNADLWKELYDKGYEIENHSYNHANVTSLNAEKLRAAIVNSEKALNAALGVNYHMSMFRCPTGDGMKDPRLHKLLSELGYKAVASWGLSGTGKGKGEKILSQIQPGQIILFHATDDDVANLKIIIPGLAKKHIEMVSVNTLYGKDKNEVTDLSTYDH